jgi:very-short-patch-repair endonuclease
VRTVNRKESVIEALFALQLRALKLPAPKRNYVFLPNRKLELDFCWPEIRLGVEVEGAVHRIKERFHGDIEKHALALVGGWTVMRVDGRSIRSGKAIEWFEALFSAVADVRTGVSQTVIKNSLGVGSTPR